jgi:hypothetical protein
LANTSIAERVSKAPHLRFVEKSALANIGMRALSLPSAIRGRERAGVFILREGSQGRLWSVAGLERPG